MAIDIFILAAGKGTRLYPITENIPKPLVPFLNKPMINYNLDLFNLFGYNNFVVNISHNKDKFKNFVPTTPNLNITYSFEDKPLGTGGGIKKAYDSKFLKADFIIVMNGDIFYDFDINKLITFNKKENPLATLVLKENKKGNITMRDNIITSLRGKKSKYYKKTDKHYSFTGLHILSDELISQIDEFCIIDTYIKLLNSNKILAIVDIENSFWADLGTLDSYLENSIYLIKNHNKLNFLNKFISKDKFNLSRYNVTNSIVGNNVTLKDNVIIKESVIFDNYTQKKNVDIINEILF